MNDGSGVAELVWFQGIKWIEKRIEVGREYLIFGRPSFFKGELSVVHPEIETIEKAFSRKAESGLQGIYVLDRAAFERPRHQRHLHDRLQPLADGAGSYPRKRCPTECGPGTACCRCAMRSTTSISRNRPNCCGRRNTG